MSQLPVLPVYVIHYNAPVWCEATVESLRNSSVPVRLHVVDNGGLGFMPGDDVVVLRQDVNRGFTGAANVALAHWLTSSAEEYCVITSHDLDLDAEALELLVAFAGEHPTTGILGPRLTGTGRGHLRHYTKAFEGTGARATPPRDRPPLPGGLRSAWVSGSCLLLRRTCVEDVGPFDERFGSYCEDVDYCVRANVRGWDVAVVEAAHGTTRGSSHTGASRLMWSNWVLTGAKHLGPGTVLRRLRRSLRRIAIATVRAIAHPSQAGAMLRVVNGSFAGMAKGIVLSLRWYAHVLGRRLRGQPPIQAVCAEEDLLVALDVRRSALCARPLAIAVLDPSLERGDLKA